MTDENVESPGVGETRDTSAAGSCGQFGQRRSAVALGTKLTGLGALLNRQSEIWKGRMTCPSD
ncbi:hypothetical protein P7K49_005291 [Saguinus oedipus]|uniref:Uncharacterized protein n=1 Tax=Saguinus oedipus TaxID=9490 RepID=A0ABQ9WBH2_SAGOE|nr:hypothetical protein P7K49_005291 [Saguinus oedipus]